jgi:tRNA dimethylallyltransferase
MNSVIFIYGPTAVGKSAFADLLATMLPIEIINMDSAQFYAPLTIGTAKPAWRHSNIPHHLFDTITEPCDYSVVQYRTAVSALVTAIQARGAIPVFVGGSGFYLKSLLFPPHNYQTKTTPGLLPDDTHLWERLAAFDPVRAAAINPHDTYRLKRALELAYHTGTLPSDHRPVYNPIVQQYHCLFLTRDRADLYTRINERVHAMFDNGWLQEVHQLQATPWEPFLMKKKFIGYNELLTMCTMHITTAQKEHTLAIIATRTRAYARRQEIFARMLIRTVRTAHPTASYICANLTSLNPDIYLKQLVALCHA